MEIIVTHKNSDFDAVASLVAATILFPGAKPVLPRALNPNVKAFVSIHKDLFPFVDLGTVDLSEVTRLIVVDTAQGHRVEGIGELLGRKGVAICVWDHHEARDDDIAADSKIQEQAGAATTLFVERVEKEGATVTPMQATLFLAGIYEDTGSLMFPTTTPRDARAAGYLLEQQGDLNILKNFLRPAYGPKQKQILFEMLQNAERTKVNGYRLSINKISISGHTPGLAVVVDMYQDIVNVDAAFGIFTDEHKGRTMVIGRSEHDGLDVGKIMRSMGGGGHPGAGSALLKNAHPDAVEAWLVELIQGNQQTSVQIGALMSFPVTTVSPGTSMKDAASLLRRTGCTGLPVVEGKKIAGIISRRDFRKIKNEKQLKAPVKAFMSQKVVTIEPGKSAMEAARKMIKHDVGRLPVVQGGELIGIVTRSDTMRYFYDMLPG
ncbi:MAG: tRNA nucleotidyl transferase [Deltaproteobacteria bacterium]|nr:MAG: tRNA nucleotidyl transferase [Deltaproteobacteria bacterium]